MIFGAKIVIFVICCLIIIVYFSDFSQYDRNYIPHHLPKGRVRYVTYWLLRLLLLHSAAHVVEHFALRLLLDVVILDT